MLAAGLMGIGMQRVYGTNAVNQDATKIDLEAHHSFQISPKQRG